MQIDNISQNSNLIIKYAKEWIGTPYHHQASVKNIGCDCLGLIRGVWRNIFGIEPETMPAYNPNWAELNDKDMLVNAAKRHLIERPITELIPGNILLFSYKENLPSKHCAIISYPQGDNFYMIHAYNLHPVAEVPINSWWRRKITYVFSFPI